MPIAEDALMSDEPDLQFHIIFIVKIDINIMIHPSWFLPFKVY